MNEAQQGLNNRIDQIQRRLGYTHDNRGTSLEDELSEASRLLDHSEGYVARNYPPAEASNTSTSYVKVWKR